MAFAALIPLIASAVSSMSQDPSAQKPKEDEVLPVAAKRTSTPWDGMTTPSEDDSPLATSWAKMANVLRSSRGY